MPHAVVATWLVFSRERYIFRMFRVFGGDSSSPPNTPLILLAFGGPVNRYRPTPWHIRNAWNFDSGNFWPAAGLGEAMDSGMSIRTSRRQQADC
jgi:hypothetical protein